MIRVAIVDDSRLARLELKEQLQSQTQFEVVGEAASVEEAVQLLESVAIDLLLLDIDLPDGDGFDVLTQADSVPQVIFVTAFDEFAIKSFEFNALDYLLKPVRSERLQQALEKVVPHSAVPDKLKADQRIFIKDGEQCFFVNLSDVYAFEAMGNYTRVHLAKDIPAIYRPLSAVAERLEQQFFRASRSWIVNTDYIDSIDAALSGGFEVKLRNKLKINISKRQASEFRRLWSL
ncbi:LytR/AlgR family response regulator transcription factor [Aliidiomarina quisquiliarum]|uniref:LytR/AlgR family response regulator transcription factor n=1 Tax=Aliidiomarina quisquiliarum TaxID=2938947 RepID=UPI00208F8645|nr:LytTR family DNA-binding domain-containing protein [Aliidiomarina quisquiliarum]MCO4321124.1 LytTR family DNA-binding domain-containing protein [Aliidiomarina quisquiliarum]